MKKSSRTYVNGEDLDVTFPKNRKKRSCIKNNGSRKIKVNKSK